MQLKKLSLCLFIFIISIPTVFAQETDQKIYDIIDSVSAKNIERDIRKLAGFGTRNTFSDTVSDTRGIGAARRWIKSQFDSIAKISDSDFNVFYQKHHVTPEDGDRIPKPAWIVNVAAVQKGTEHPNNYIIMTGDIDSRASDVNNYKIDAPGANDNASGMAGVMESARVLSHYKFKNSIVYLGLSGEEQGLFGGKSFAKYAKKQGWNIIGVFNNDMIGNIHGIDGVVDNRSFRIFSEPVPPNETERERTMRRYYGGEVDGISRQLARYFQKTVKTYMPQKLDPMMIYRLDRFGRGGHHKPFNDLGFAGIRIMETHENYNRQHQDVRTENGIDYGDVVSGVNFDYARKLTAANAINLASLAWAPPAPENVKIGGIVEPSTKLKWKKASGDVAGYKIYWRKTTSPTWDYSRFVGYVDHFTLKNIVIDNFYFGISTVGKNGHESVVRFPSGVFR
jgi:hypothetical protein